MPTPSTATIASVRISLRLVIPCHGFQTRICAA
jgi:hypothetical protein